MCNRIHTVRLYFQVNLFIIITHTLIDSATNENVCLFSLQLGPDCLAVKLNRSEFSLVPLSVKLINRER